MNRSIFKAISFCLHVMCGFALVALSFHHASAKQTAATRSVSSRISQPPLTDEEIQEEMKKFLGIRYRKAGASRKGFDCSGFVKVVYQEIFGVDLPHQSSQQSRCPEFETIPLDSLQTGDLVFFSSNHKKKAINHVGIYLSEGKFIHSARSQGVVISGLNDPYWRPKVIVAKRLEARLPVESERSTLDLAMSVGSQSTLSFRYEKGEVFGNDLGGFLARDQFHIMELDYASTLYPLLTSHFTVFREHSFSADQGGLLRYHTILASPEHFDITRDYVQGLRVAGGIRPAENIMISPSLSFFDYGPFVDEAALPKLALELTLDLFPSSRGWSLSTELSLPLSRYSPSALDEAAEDRTLNLSLTYRQQLSDRVHLSITGDNFIKLVPGSRAPSARLDTQDQRFGLMLHFFY